MRRVTIPDLNSHEGYQTVPMLFLQGTRDTFADLKLLRPICAELRPQATLHIVKDADHSFRVLKGKKDRLRGVARVSGHGLGMGGGNSKKP
jgi:hypothetical protein